MRLVRGRADARWLPSRHNFALFRLVAYLRLRCAQPEHRNVILIIDRHQSAAETWLVMSWVMLMLACYLSATLFFDWHVALALLASLPLAIVLLEVPVFLSALTIAPVLRSITRGRATGIRTNSVVMMLLFTATSAYFARHPTWIRFVAWQFFALLALNAMAAVIAFLLRGSIARLEAGMGSALGGVTSAQ